jgi:molybdate transport system substrate-binding protein
MSLQLSSCFAVGVALFLPAQIVCQNTVELSVAAAADLTSLEPSLTTAFEKTNPAIRVRFANQASALLAQQIENGAPYDLFLSANALYIDRLASSGSLLSASVRIYATGRLAALWKDEKRHPLSDLAQNWVRFVALPNPKLAPYGVAARQALEHAGLWKEVQPKIVYGENVRQTLQLFDSGNADAVLTADSLIQDRQPDLIPADWHQPIIQKAGIVAASKKQGSAGIFLNWLTGPAGQAILAKFGFGPP